MCDDDNEPSADEIATTCRKARHAEAESSRRYHLRHLSLDDEDAQDKIGELSDHGAGVERMLDYLDRKDAAKERTVRIQALKRKIFGKITWGVNNGRNSKSVCNYNDAIKAIPSADRADFKANPRRWLKSHFEHSPKVFGALWAECRREYFDDLRRCFRFLGLDYVTDREEVYPPIFPDEVLSEAEERIMPEYIKHHIKRGGKSEEGRGGRDGREQKAVLSEEGRGGSFERGGRREEGGGADGRAARPAPPRKRFADNGGTREDKRHHLIEERKENHD